MTETVRLGVIGTGNMGALHTRVASDSQGVELVGLFDADTSRANDIAARYGTQAFASAEELIGRCDGVIIAAPSTLHHDYARMCIDAGTGVLVEKPVAVAVEEGEDLVRRAEAAGVVAHVGHIERFNPTFGEISRVLEGRTLRSLALRRTSPFTPQAQDIDVTLDLMIHDLDLAFALAGAAPSGIAAEAHTIQARKPDLVTALLGLENGVSVVLTASKASFEKVRVIEAHADDASIRADLLTREVWVHQRIDDAYREEGSFVTYQQQTVVERIFAAPVEPLRAEQRAFTDALRGQDDRGVSLAEGTLALKVALSIIAAYGG